MKHKELNIAVFVSGRGSNLQAIIDAQELRSLASVTAVISDKKDCAAFTIAEKNSIRTFCTGSGDGCIKPEELSGHLRQLQINLIVLAGYLKLIPADVIEIFENRIINIHPALLPSFGGKGMYGLNVHKAVFNSSAHVSGASVHFVDNTYDTGKIIAQRCVDISDVKSPEEIAERVLKIEHQLLPFVVKKFAEGKVKEINNRIIILD